MVKCTLCDNEYSSYVCMWRHRKIKHSNINTITDNNTDSNTDNNTDNNTDIINHFNCKYCTKELSNRHSLWRHENKSCKKNPKIVIKKTVITNQFNVSDQGTVNQTINNNITINFMSLENQNVLDLTEKQKEEIINDGIDGIITLIKHLNFNKDIPQNHLFCTTNINNKYVNALNLETNKIEKVRKFDFFEKIFKNSLKHMKTLNNTIKDFDIQDKFEKKISDIEKRIFNYLEPYHMKLYHDDLNILSYNQRDIVRKTWEDSLDKNNTPLLD